MNPEEQRIAIAEACGWDAKPSAPAWNVVWGSGGKKPHWNFLHQIPDYLNDLNAMHEAEKVLSMGQLFRYEFYLNTMDLRNDNYGYVLNVVNATAAQRAEAFLKTIGKWND